MATKREALIEKQLSCSVCLKSFQEPKVLPCWHSFCLKCLEGILERAEDKKEIACPQCKTKHQVPDNGVHSFLNDYTLSTALEDQHKPTRPVTCQQCCEGREAVTYCLTCSHLCQDCLEAHKKLKVLQGHQIRQEDSDEQLEVKPKKTHYCRLHPQEVLTLYCKECHSIACLQCLMASHKDHDFVFVDTEQRKEVETLLTDFVTKTDIKLKEFEQNLQYVTQVEKTKSEKAAPIKAKINKRIDSMIAQLDAKRNELLEKVDECTNKDLKELWAQKEYLESSILRMRNTVSFAKRALQCENDMELLELGTQTLSHLKVLSQLEWDSQETENIEVTCTTLDLDTTKLNIVGEIKSVDVLPTIEITSDEVPDSIQQGQVLTFKVTTRYQTLPEMIHSRGNKMTLSGSATCNGPEQKISFDSQQQPRSATYTDLKPTFGFGPQQPLIRSATFTGRKQKSSLSPQQRHTQFSESATVTVVKESDSVWDITCSPPHGTDNISLQLNANMEYGRRTVSASETYYIQVYK